MSHKCPREDCARTVGPEQLACRKHWFLVSRATRNRVWSAWKHGTPEQHRAAMQVAIAEINGRKPE